MADVIPRVDINQKQQSLLQWRARPIDADFFNKVIPSRAFLYPVFAILCALKILSVFAVIPLADEGYYWLWGKNLSWSYYDHPPLGGWYLGAINALFGDSLYVSRAGTLPVFAGTLCVLWYWVKRLTPNVSMRRDVFITSVGVMIATPWMLQYQSILFHDYLLIGTGIGAAHFFALFVEKIDQDERPYRYLYAACIFLGLAGLSKYSGVFIGLGFGLWVLLSPKGRKLLNSPHLYFAAGVAVAMQMPVLYWNHMHGWPSFQYNLYDRIGDTMNPNPWYRLGEFAKNFILLISPLMFLALVRFVVQPSENPVLKAFQMPGRFVFAVSTLVFAGLCFSTSVLFYWNVTALLFFLPVALFFFTSAFEIRMHMIWGIFFSAMAVFNATIFPLTALSDSKMSDFNISHGLQEVAAIVEEEEARLKPEMLLTTDYRTASLLALTTQRTDISSMGLREDMFDFWFKPEEHKGQNALVLVYDRFPETELITTNFEKVSTVREFTIRRYGHDLQNYKLVYAENYSGEGQH
ncbi:glycosyltransferase family 39 protein [Ahrensia kielensis]|uniref:Glycosyltransferase family 39 protein n=1 Tax=Ahrensia kielensis TaxID=76980 RepID=A0ABU9T742_9HYPH